MVLRHHPALDLFLAMIVNRSEGEQKSAEQRATLLSTKGAAEVIGVTVREIQRRIKTGELAAVDGPSRGGRPGKLIPLAALPERAKRKWFERQASDIGRGATESTSDSQLPTLEPSTPSSVGAEPVTPDSKLQTTEQGDLFYSNTLAGLKIPNEKKDVINRRFEILRVAMNGDFRAAGYERRELFINAQAKQYQVSGRSIYRWARRVREALGESGVIDFEDVRKDHKALLALLDKVPGPSHSDPVCLQDWQKYEIQYSYTVLKLKPKQIYRELIRRTHEKANSDGWRNEDHYEFPTYRAVLKYIKRLSPLAHAARHGEEALKEACGYVDRSYQDLRSLERVETDEWKCDFLAYHPVHPKIVKRWWLLTFYDERSMYPLCWKLVSGSEYELRRGISENDEIELLVSLVRDYGVPGAIHSDHGRFRGGTFGGRANPSPTVSCKFQNLYGILDRMGIRKSEPREKNPKGNRLERFHRWLADCSRTIPGWIGANTDEREMSPGDAQLAEHQRWLQGHQRETPLLSIDQALLKINQWMESWRDHESGGTDMRGLSPRAMFNHNIPPEGFRKLTEEEIAWHTAEHFPNRLIEGGGIVTLPDGSRYSAPELVLIQGERREAVRLRDDHSKISVLPAVKGESVIVAARRKRVGTHDEENLARQMELKARLLQLAGKMIEPMEMQLSVVGRPADKSPIPDDRRTIIETNSAALYCASRDQDEAIHPQASGIAKIQPLDFTDLEA
jgi:hypothetical protein